MRWLGCWLLLLAAPVEIIAQANRGAVCRTAEGLKTISTDVRETSGLALSRQQPGVLWTHNDSGNEAELYALDTTGTIKARFPIPGLRTRDWEDIEGGVCDAGYCLYIADIGDNAGARSLVSIYEIAEPRLDADAIAVRRTISAAYEDGPQDAEALFRLPDGQLYVVTKGRQKAITLYRLDDAGDHPARLRRVRQLAPRPSDERDRVTAATASANGEWVAIRTYRTLWLYRTRDLLSGRPAAVSFPLAGLREKQGEAVALDDAGNVWLTSEAERSRDEPTLARLTCRLPR